MAVTSLKDREIKVLKKGLEELAEKINPSTTLEIRHLGEGRFCELNKFIGKLHDKLAKLEDKKLGLMNSNVAYRLAYFNQKRPNNDRI